MAYEYKTDEEEQNMPGSTSGGLITGAGGSGLAGGAPKQEGTSPNIKDYLDANTRQGQMLADKIGGDITTRGQGVRSSIDTTKTNFGNTVNQNTVNLNRGLVDSAKNDSANFVQDQGNVTQFKNMRDATYKGPTDLNDYGAYSGLQSQAKQVMERANLVDTDSGRQTLIREMSKRPMTQGAAALNNALVSQNQGALETLQNAKKGVSDLQDYLDKANAYARGLSDQGRATTQATRDTIHSEFKGAQGVIPQLQTQAQQRVVDLRNQARGADNAAMKALGVGGYQGMTDADAATLGLSRDDLKFIDDRAQRLSALGNNNFNIQDYISRGNPDAEITLDNATTREEQARAAALASLFDETPYLPQSDRAGTALSELVDFNASGAKDRVRELLRAAEIDNLSKNLGNYYYDQVGQHTGQGDDATWNYRDVNDLVRTAISRDQGLTGGQQEGFFTGYGSQYDPAMSEFMRRLEEGRTRIKGV